MTFAEAMNDPSFMAYFNGMKNRKLENPSLIQLIEYAKNVIKAKEAANAEESKRNYDKINKTPSQTQLIHPKDKHSTKPIEKLWVLPTQCGKTFQCIQTIAKYETGDLHFVFTLNLVLAVEQFATRIVNELGGYLSVVTITSKQIGDILRYTAKELKQKLLFGGQDIPAVVICCSNHARFDDIFTMIPEIDSAQESEVKRVFIHLDEAHMFINWKADRKSDTNLDKRQTVQQRLDIIRLNRLGRIQIQYYTATPDTILEERNANMELIHQPHSLNLLQSYHGFLACRFLHIDDGLPFKSWIKKFQQHIFVPGARVFFPASSKIATHKLVRDTILSIQPNAVVAMINGTNKDLYATGKHGVDKIFDLGSDQPNTQGNLEIWEKIAMGLEACKVEPSRPLVITGRLCVSTGQTLMDPRTGNFTSAVFHPQFVKDKISQDAAYQLAGRVTGKCKDWLSCTPETSIFCTKAFQEKFACGEQAALEIMLSAENEVID